LILLILLTLAARNSSYAQYVKKIGGEEKIIITKSEGQRINAAFDSLNNILSSQNSKIDSLLKTNQSVKDSLKLEISSLFRVKDTLNYQNKVNLDTLNDYKSRYYKNIAVYNQFEKDVKFEQKLHRFNSTLFTLLVIFLYSQIK
jgi:dsDNA-specific endonuclease/ATPase MutS2